MSRVAIEFMIHDHILARLFLIRFSFQTIVKATWAAYSSVLGLNLQNANNRMENSSFAKCQKIGGVNLLVKEGI